MPKILTVSVAAYNMDKYLDECLESMAIPEIVDDLEVFVIDDGGTDRSLEIAQSYADKYPGTFIPVHKENGGWGSTVNYSIQHATGKYFKILDGDDWFDKNGIVRLIQELKQTKADVVVTYFYRAKQNGTIYEKISIAPDSDMRPLEKVMNQMPILNLHVLCYRTAILKVSGLVCPEHKLYCDLYYQTIPFLCVDTIQSFAFPVTYYRLGREGQSVSVVSKIKHQDEIIWICKDLLLHCRNAKKNDAKNYVYIMRRTAETYRVTMSFLRLNPVNRESLAKIKSLDKCLYETSQDVYEYTTNHCGKFIWLMRKTNYISYWLQSLLNKAGNVKEPVGGG